MAKKAYTILIISQKAAQVKKLILSPLTLKISGILMAVVLLISGYSIFKYFNYIKKNEDLHHLQSETYSQQAEIQSFQGKISLLEEQLDRLKEMEKQMEKDLKEVTDLKKTKRAIPLVSRKKASPPKMTGKRMVVSKETRKSRSWTKPGQLWSAGSIRI